MFVYRSQWLIYIYTLSQTLPVFSIPRPREGLNAGSQTWMPTHDLLTILRTDHHLVRSELRQKHKKPNHINLTKMRTDKQALNHNTIDIYTNTNWSPNVNDSILAHNRIDHKLSRKQSKPRYNTTKQPIINYQPYKTSRPKIRISK